MPDGEVMRLGGRDENVHRQEPEKAVGFGKDGHQSRDRPREHIYPRMMPDQVVDMLNHLPDGVVMEVYFEDGH